MKQTSAILLLAVVLEYLVLFWIGVNMKKVFADNFFPSAVTESSKFYTTFSLGYSLQSVTRDLEFQTEKISGRTLSELSTSNLSSYIENPSMYTRVVTDKDNLVIPPLSEVMFGVYMYNDTTHTVGIGNSWLFLGQYEKRPITDVLELSEVMYRNVAYASGASLLTKGGASIQLGPFGNITAAKEGTSGYYSQTRILGKVINPVHYEVKSAECAVNDYGNHGTHMILDIANSGKLEEKISIFGGASLVLAPGETRSGYSVFAVGSASSIKISVENEVTRCLQRGAGSPLYGSPDSHSLVLSRNDDNHFLWYGTVLNMPSMDTAEQFCITRMPYVVNIPTQICVEKPRYKPNMMSPDRNVISEEVKKIAVEIQNIGGNDLRSDELKATIRFPEIWTPYIEYESADPGVKIVVGEKLLLEGLSVKNLPKDGAVSGHFIIKGPAFLSQEQARSFVIQVDIEGERSELELFPKSFFKRSIISSEKLCHDSQSILQLKILLEGNVNVSEMQLQVNSMSETTREKRITLTWGEQITEYTYLSGKSVIIPLKGSFQPGVFTVSVSVLEPWEGGLSVGLAENTDIANTLCRCPVMGITPTIELSQTQIPTKLLPKDQRAVLGQKRSSTTREVTRPIVERSVEFEKEQVYLPPVVAIEVETEKVRENYIFVIVPLIVLVIVILLLRIGLPRKSGSR